MEPFPDKDKYIQLIETYLDKTRNLDLSSYRRISVRRKLNGRLHALGMSCYADYVRYLQSDPDEIDLLLDNILVGTSCFFRDPIVFEHLGREILPKICEEREEQSGLSPLAVWSCGCSSGEEAYSAAIMIRNLQKNRFSTMVGVIFATDIDPRALETAREGRYPGSRLEYVRLGDAERYFEAENGSYRVKPEIRNMVSFSVHDVLRAGNKVPRDFVFRHFDIILCRNILIYMDPDAQARVLDNLDDCLATGGYLVLGETETVGRRLEDKLEPIGRYRIYRKKY